MKIELKLNIRKNSKAQQIAPNLKQIFWRKQMIPYNTAAQTVYHTLSLKYMRGGSDNGKCLEIHKRCWMSHRANTATNTASTIISKTNTVNNYACAFIAIDRIYTLPHTSFIHVIAISIADWLKMTWARILLAETKDCTCWTNKMYAETRISSEFHLQSYFDYWIEQFSKRKSAI